MRDVTAIFSNGFWLAGGQSETILENCGPEAAIFTSKLLSDTSPWWQTVATVSSQVNHIINAPTKFKVDQFDQQLVWLLLETAWPITEQNIDFRQCILSSELGHRWLRE